MITIPDPIRFSSHHISSFFNQWALSLAHSETCGLQPLLDRLAVQPFTAALVGSFLGRLRRELELQHGSQLQPGGWSGHAFPDQQTDGWTNGPTKMGQVPVMRVLEVHWGLILMTGVRFGQIDKQMPSTTETTPISFHEPYKFTSVTHKVISKHSFFLG